MRGLVRGELIRMPCHQHDPYANLRCVESPCTNAALAFTKDSTRCAGCYATLELPDGSSATCMEICAPLLVGGP